MFLKGRLGDDRRNHNQEYPRNPNVMECIGTNDGIQTFVRIKNISRNPKLKE